MKSGIYFVALVAVIAGVSRPGNATP